MRENSVFHPRFFASFFHTHKVINKLGHFFRVTQRFGDEDVWELYHNMPGNEWVYVRDHKLSLTYYGWIYAYSDSEKERELLMQDVEVFSSEEKGEPLYHRKILYISRHRHDLTIEVPLIPDTIQRTGQQSHKQET